MLFFCLLLNLIVVLLTYFLSAYNDKPKHANVVHSISIYTPKPSKHSLSYRLSTNLAKNKPISVPTKLSAAKKVLEYSFFIRVSKQFIVMPYFMTIMTNKCPNLSMKTQRARISSSLCLFVPICTWNTKYNNHVASNLIIKPVRKKTKTRASKRRESISQSQMCRILRISVLFRKTWLCRRGQTMLNTIRHKIKPLKNSVIWQITYTS